MTGLEKNRMERGHILRRCDLLTNSAKRAKLVKRKTIGCVYIRKSENFHYIYLKCKKEEVENMFVLGRLGLKTLNFHLKGPS